MGGQPMMGAGVEAGASGPGPRLQSNKINFHAKTG
jgi:hypothetical protein